MGRPNQTDRAVSELTSALAILVLAVLVIAVVGANVFLAPSENQGPEATFSYQHFEDQRILLITYDSGEAIPAGRLEFAGHGSTASWAALNERMNESTPVTPGDAVQIGPQGAFGTAIPPDGSVTVNWVNETGTRVSIDAWNGTR